MSSDFPYPERHVIILIDNEPTLLACALKLAEETPPAELPERFKRFITEEAVDLIPWRNQVGKDSFRDNLAIFADLQQDRQIHFWMEAAKWYANRLQEGANVAWALPDSWR